MTKRDLYVVILLAFTLGYASAQVPDAGKTLHNLPDSLQSDSTYIPSRSITEINTLVDETKIMPQSPTVGSISSYVDRPVSYFSGTAGIDVPLCTVKAYDIELPVSLSYGSTGCQPSQEASWVGLGWNLSLNACISRTVRCTDDFCEYSSNGHIQKGYYKSDVVPDTANVLPSSYFVTTQLSYDLSVYLTQDPEPDIFYFSFWGGSSKFIIDKYPGTGAQFTDKESGWKLQIVSGYTGYTFVLIAKDGTKYWFDKKEYTKSLSAAPRETSIFSSSQQPGDLPGITTYSEYTSSWFLSKIQSPTGHIVNFEYEREYYVSPIYESCQSCYYNNGYVNNPLYFLSRSAVDTWRLKRIYWDNGSIRFWTSPREDVTANRYNYLMSLPANTNPSERLDSIAICDASGNTCRKFKMTYSYFNGTATGDSAFLYKRLKMDKVTEVTLPANQYQFGYNTGSFPVKNTKNVDYWGYYNGADYQTLYYSVAWNGGTLNWGRVKSSVEQYASIGMLTSVTYPTGGTETFEYELNQFNGLGSITGTTVESSHRAMYAYNISQSPTNPMWQSDTVTFEKDAYLRIELQGTNYQTGDCLLRIYSGTQVIREYDCPWNLGPGIQHPKYETTLPAGTYIFEMPAPPRDGMVLSASIDIDSFTRPISGVSAVNGAGMRIKRITGGGRQRTFDYSLGVLLVDPIPGFLKIEYAPSEMNPNFFAQYFTQQSESVRPLMSMSHGNLVGYESVTETDGVHKSVFMYHAYREMPPFPCHPMLPVSPNFQNGKPLRTYKYDEDQIVSETQYYYHVRRSDSISSFYVYPRTATCIKSSFQIAWYPVSQVIDYLYDTHAASAAPMVNTTSYEIDDYLQNTRMETVRDNITYSTTYKYVYDYPNDNLCTAMTAANCLYPVETIDYADSQIIAGKRYVYQQAGSLFLPYKVRTLDISASVTESNYSNHFHDDVVFNSFDSHGNVLQMTVKGMPVTYIWSYKGELPVAEIRNATYNQLSANINFSTFCSKTSLSSQDIAQLNSLRSLYPSSEVTVLKYNNRHLVSEMSDPQGQKFLYEYDNQGRLTEQYVVIDGMSQQVKSYEYVINGN